MKKQNTLNEVKRAAEAGTPEAVRELGVIAARAALAVANDPRRTRGAAGTGRRADGTPEADGGGDAVKVRTMRAAVTEDAAALAAPAAAPGGVCIDRNGDALPRMDPRRRARLTGRAEARRKKAAALRAEGGEKAREAAAALEAEAAALEAEAAALEAEDEANSAAAGHVLNGAAMDIAQAAALAVLEARAAAAGTAYGLRAGWIERPAAVYRRGRGTFTDAAEALAAAGVDNEAAREAYEALTGEALTASEAYKIAGGTWTEARPVVGIFAAARREIERGRALDAGGRFQYVSIDALTDAALDEDGASDAAGGIDALYLRAGLYSDLYGAVPGEASTAIDAARLLRDLAPSGRQAEILRLRAAGLSYAAAAAALGITEDAAKKAFRRLRDRARALIDGAGDKYGGMVIMDAAEAAREAAEAAAEAEDMRRSAEAEARARGRRAEAGFAYTAAALRAAAALRGEAVPVHDMDAARAEFTAAEARAAEAAREKAEAEAEAARARNNARRAAEDGAPARYRYAAQAAAPARHVWSNTRPAPAPWTTPEAAEARKAAREAAEAEAAREAAEAREKFRIECIAAREAAREAARAEARRRHIKRAAALREAAEARRAALRAFARGTSHGIDNAARRAALQIWSDAAKKARRLRAEAIKI